VNLEDTGTYYCAAGSDVIQVDSVNLVVKRTNTSLGYPFNEELQDAPLFLPIPESTTTASSGLPKAPEPQVTIHPPVVNATVGERVQFKCSVAEEREGVEVYWRRQDAPIALDVAINGSTITFHSVELGHAGAYYCIFADELRKSNAKAVLNVVERSNAAPAVPAKGGMFFSPHLFYYYRC